MEPTYVIADNFFRNLVQNMVSEGKSINKDNIDELIKKASYPKLVDKSKVYSCPKCGKMTLRVEHLSCVSDYPYIHRYHIVCSECEFECRKSRQRGQADA